MVEVVVVVAVAVVELVEEVLLRVGSKALWIAQFTGAGGGSSGREW